MNHAKTVADNLRAWMDATPGMESMHKVAEKAGCGYGTVQRVLTGSANITLENLEKIASAFGRSVAELVSPACVRPTSVMEPTMTPYTIQGVRKRPLAQRICELADRISDVGLLKATGYLECLAGEYPHRQDADDHK